MNAVSDKNSYSQILKASSIVGGAQGVVMVVGLVKTKVAAVLLGPAGTGLLGNYTTLTALLGSLAGLGIRNSGVRDIAESAAEGDEERIGKLVITLRRISLLTGILGALALALLSPWLSQRVFGNDEQTGALAILGSLLFLSSIQGGQVAIIQGMRRIGDLARLKIFGASAGALTSIGFFLWLGVEGIVPALIAGVAINLAFTTWYVRRIPVPEVTISWRESLTLGKALLRLGFAFVWGSLLATLVTVVTRSLITSDLGLKAVGIFGAAFALSAMFVQFVLNAMSADYYPRLTGVSSDNQKMNGLINEQSEIGLLLAFPGLLATLALGPLIIQLFYSAEYAASADLLKWFVIGCLGRVAIWPMGYSMLAKGKGGLFAATQTFANLLHILLIWLGLRYFGLIGVSYAFGALYLAHGLVVFVITRSLTNFSWSLAMWRLVGWMVPVAAIAFLCSHAIEGLLSLTLGMLLTVICAGICLRGLLQRIGPSHRIHRIFSKYPMLRRLFAST